MSKLFLNFNKMNVIQEEKRKAGRPRKEDTERPTPTSIDQNKILADKKEEEKKVSDKKVEVKNLKEKLESIEGLTLDRTVKVNGKIIPKGTKIASTSGLFKTLISFLK